MKTSEQYMSFVSNRIKSLETKLSNPNLQTLEREFIERRIQYLKKLTDLPLLMTINNMSDEELQAIETKYGYSKESAKAFLIRLFNLETVANIIKQPKTVTLGYIKEALIGDFHTMATLIELQQRNFEYERKKQALYGVGLDGSVSYLQLTHDEKRLNLQNDKIEQAIDEAAKDYNYETLKELHALKANRQNSLPLEFILKHKDKVEKNPEMKKLAKRLTRKGILGKIDKFLPFRKKREQQYLDAVLESYKTSNALSTLGIIEQDITTMNEHQIKSLIKRIQKQTRYHRNKMTQAKEEVKTAKSVILKQVKEYEVLQAQDKKQFMEILSTKTNFLPRMFQDQIWNEPDFKESLMRVACYEEEKQLLEQLSNPVQNRTEVLTLISSERPKTYIKKAA